MRFVTPGQLREILQGEDEFALLDVRERNPFSREHLLLSSCVPLSRIEILAGTMVPRLSTKVVVIGEGPSDEHRLAERAFRRLRELGYTDVSVLEGGFEAWLAAGFELFSGVGAYAKAFGEWVAEKYKTPAIPAREQHRRLSEKRNQVILDCRPGSEYRRMTIPGSVNAPGADLVYRFYGAVSDPKAEVIVHCAGRTRSIIGAQSLVNAGIPNPVMALENGTMGWQLAGFALEYGQGRRAPMPSAEGLAKARQAAERVARRFGVRKLSYEELERWRAETEARTTYVIDVRLPDEYSAGHLEGSRNVQGGQLVQAADEYMCVFNSRVVLIDDTEVRAIMTASWLIQMGWRDVYILEGGIGNLPLVQAAPQQQAPFFEKSEVVSCRELRSLLESAEIVLIDVASSAYHKARHIPGARWAIRSRLPVELCRAIPAASRVVLTSEDGALAHLAARDLKESGVPYEVAVLEGGTGAWIEAGLPVSSGFEDALSEEDDAWYMPYMHPDAPDEAKRAYFEWEYGLVAQVERDGGARYRFFAE